MTKEECAVDVKHICPCCSTRADLYIKAEDLNHKVSSSVFNYYMCRKCGLIFLSPVPGDLSIYYDTEYPPYMIPKSHDDLEMLANRVSWRVDFLKQYVKEGRLLEIGPSYGAFAYAATKSGFSVDVIELDKTCCEFISCNIAGVRAIHGDVLSGMSSLHGKYDAIVFWHNLEHLADPWVVLEESIRMLSSNGVLIISTPNPGSLQFKLFKKNWVHLDAPRHLMLMPRFVLSKFLAKRGLGLVFATTADPDGIALNKMGWGVSLTNILRTPKKSIFRKIISNLLNKLMIPFERWMQFGAAYTAVFKKIG